MPLEVCTFIQQSNQFLQGFQSGNHWNVPRSVSRASVHYFHPQPTHFRLCTLSDLICKGAGQVPSRFPHPCTQPCQVESHRSTRARTVLPSRFQTHPSIRSPLPTRNQAHRSLPTGPIQSRGHIRCRTLYPPVPTFRALHFASA